MHLKVSQRILLMWTLQRYFIPFFYEDFTGSNVNISRYHGLWATISPSWWSYKSCLLTFIFKCMTLWIDSIFVPFREHPVSKISLEPENTAKSKNLFLEYTIFSQGSRKRRRKYVPKAKFYFPRHMPEKHIFIFRWVVNL